MSNLSNIFNNLFSDIKDKKTITDESLFRELDKGKKYMQKRDKLINNMRGNLERIEAFENRDNASNQGVGDNQPPYIPEVDYPPQEELWTKGIVGRRNVEKQLEYEMNEMERLEKEFRSSLTKYTEAYKGYMENMFDNYNSEKSKYYGKIVEDITTKSKYYITKGGVSRWFSKETWNNRHNNSCNNLGKVILLEKRHNEYGFIIGEHMKSNEPCGYEGMNIRVTNAVGESTIISRMGKGVFA